MVPIGNRDPAARATEDAAGNIEEYRGKAGRQLVAPGDGTGHAGETAAPISRFTNGGFID